MKYETVIGLEVHSQLSTASKLFCGCPTSFGGEPNSHTCPLCLGMPGVLPVLNAKAVEFAVKTALALNCTINPKSVFARKNYFYPDLPKGYQISQYDEPLAEHGHLDIEVDGQKKRIGITRIHMEEDAGKLIHGEEGDDANFSFVDLNRAGVPLIEIVSEPDMRNPLEAQAYLKALRDIVVYLEVCDGNMEQGSFRCDANISIMPAGATEFGTRAELKNMNSFKFIKDALVYEIQRQTDVLDNGDKVKQESRLFNPSKGITASMRSKEEAHDYRYFPEPDLLPLVIEDSLKETLAKTLPELPEAKRLRFTQDYSIPPYDAGVLTSTKELADYFEAVVEKTKDAKVSSNWIMGELLRLLKEESKDISACTVTPESIAELINMIKKGDISGKMAKDVFEEMFKTGKGAEDIVKAKGLSQISDETTLIEKIDEVMAANPKEVEGYRAGKDKLIGFFVGAVMKATRGAANPEAVNRLLKERLSK